MSHPQDSRAEPPSPAIHSIIRSSTSSQSFFFVLRLILVLPAVIKLPHLLAFHLTNSLPNPPCLIISSNPSPSATMGAMVTSGRVEAACASCQTRRFIRGVFPVPLMQFVRDLVYASRDGPGGRALDGDGVSNGSRSQAIYIAKRTSSLERISPSRCSGIPCGWVPPSLGFLALYAACGSNMKFVEWDVCVDFLLCRFAVHKYVYKFM